MLELKNVSKIYKAKGGADVKALDNVSLSFEETGLVFLLGKSGSGKSTLLNLAGGLDDPTSGEIVVMGKSSKDFSGSDFDSYRNTFVGFIFQEYNVLNEFNVEDNIALALKLQGKTKDKEKIQTILEEVELANFAKRKPNTLSGGQKQRIAIARALIKDPQIIMADEPTGALDSATGKQVFNTLKKLSLTRLVIVVSHDRESAEIYGDRIIELRDGKIISDVTKVKAPAGKLNENVTLIGEDTLSIRSGAPLTKENLEDIQKFVAESHNDVIITRGYKEVKTFKRANRIGGDDSLERFESTPVRSGRGYRQNEAKFIRSRLPLKTAIRMGASGLKVKPFRLILTVLLSAIAFILFGLSSTLMLYNEKEVIQKSYFESDYTYLSIIKNYTAERTYTYSDGSSATRSTELPARLTPEEITALGGKTAFGAYSVSLSPANVLLKESGKSYYYLGINKAAYVQRGNALRENLVAGSYPLLPNQICVSKFFFESVRNADFYEVDDSGEIKKKPTTIKSESELIGKNLLFSGEIFQISGIFQCGDVPEKYRAYQTAQVTPDRNYTQFREFLADGLFETVLISENFAREHESLIIKETPQYFEFSDESYAFYYNQTSLFWNSAYAVYEPEGEHYNVNFFKGNTLAGNQLAIYIGDLSVLVNAMEDLPNKTAEELAAFSRINDAFVTLMNGTVITIENGFDLVEREATEAEMFAAKVVVDDYLRELNPVMTIKKGNYGAESTLAECEVTGYYLESKYSTGIYCSQSLFDSMDFMYRVIVTTETKYVPEENAVYDYLIVPFVKTESVFRSLTNGMKPNLQTDVTYRFYNSLSTAVSGVSYVVDVLKNVFLILGIVLALFSGLLLFNFISVSISYKKKDIGILRAVGARGTDVFKIFLSESGIIVGFCVVLALIGTFILTFLLNQVLKSSLGLNVTLFVFGALPALLLIGIAFFVAVLSTFLPVYLASRKKPVDCIRAL